MTQFNHALPNMISQVTCYCSETKTRFLISRIGLRYNNVSEASQNFNKWVVIKNPGVSFAQLLQNVNDEWVASYPISTAEEQVHADVLFESLEDAFNALSKKVGASLKSELIG